MRAAQQELLAAHGAATALLASSQDSLAAAQAACAALLEPVPSDESAGDGTDGPAETTDPADPVDPAETADPTETTDPADPTETTDPADTLTSCQDAVTQLLADQQLVAAAQASVDTLATALDASVATARQVMQQAATDAAASTGGGSDASSGGAGGTSTGASGGTSAGTPPSTSAGTADSAGSTPTGATASAAVQVASAQDLLADQAAIDEAEATLAIARRDLELATLTTPIAGTVASVSLEVGDAASSGSAVLTVLGTSGHVVTTTLDLSEIDTVHVGQTATVVVAGVEEDLGAAVTSIGILDVSTTSTPSYTVVLAVDPTQAVLFDGSSAQVSIDVAAQDATLTVPTSAVHRTAAGATVQQLVDGSLVDVEVGIGTVGTERTEISSGLVEGDQVVLADLTTPLVSDSTSTDGGLSGLGADTSTTPTDAGGPGGGAPAGRPQQGG